MAEARRRVAILGGGIAGLTAAYELSSPDQPNPPEVTLYQLGWRLGGKCASGRDPSAGFRVQEHGLHVFFGFYDNAFAMLRDCYAQLDLSKDRYKTLWDALQPYDQITVTEEIGGKQVPWVINCPPLPGLPGDPNPPSLWSILCSVLKWLLETHSSILDGLEGNQSLVQRVEGKLHRAVALAEGLHKVAVAHEKGDHEMLAALIRGAAQDLLERVQARAGFDDKLRRLLTLFDFVAANALGGLEDGFLLDPYHAAQRVNDMEYRDWLSSHSILHLAEKSAVLRALYDLIFAYPGGDVNAQGNVAAGAMFLGLFQLWQYRGSILWKMKTATGDIVAGPLYKLLLKRGVKFEFFSRVDALTPAADGETIDTVTIGRQVTLTSGTYQPFIRVNDLDCWPSEPLYEQIDNGNLLQQQKVDLESPWSSWAHAPPPVTLKRGQDFDDVVLAISVAALPPICGQLANADQRWQRMMDEVQTVETMNVQLWFDRTLQQMGWGGKDGTLLGGYDVSQLDTWADISEVLPSENWGTNGPRNASILCGPMKGPAQPPLGDPTYPATAQKAITAAAADFLQDHSAALWPALNQNGSFDWNALHAAPEIKGPDRLLAQYIRPNIFPSERYVMSCAGTIEARIRADDTGFANLTIAGDWIDNPQNLGSFEASVMSGKLASRALTGLPKEILRVDPKNPLLTPPTNGPPRFVEPLGNQTYPGRIDFKDVTLNSFWFEANYDKLAAICRTCFDEPSGGAVSCVPLSSWMMMSFADMGKGRFDSRPNMGWSAEKELAFWIFVGRKKAPDSDEIDEAFLFNPVLCLDNPVAMMDGREVFGFNKQKGWVDMTPRDAAAPAFKVDVFGAAVDGPNVQWGRVPLLKLDGSLWLTAPGEILTDLAEVVAGLVREVPNLLPLRPGLPLLAEFLRALVDGTAPILFLKQFRDIENQDLACYQAICAADSKVTGFHSARLMKPGTLTISPVANLQITEAFGISPSTATGIGVQLNIDMAFLPGRELWRAEPTK
jgi:uncharacterized protein with NAD-binding domain and iron-sulfur cluster